MSAQAEFDDRRTGQRYSCRQKVYLQGDDTFLGYAENINPGGMLLVTKQPLELFEHFDLWFGAEKEEKLLNRIFVSAYPVWHKHDKDKDLHYSGMRYTYLDEQTVEKIQELLNHLVQELTA